jgi:outer membrane protein assembly factor BamB
MARARRTIAVAFGGAAVLAVIAMMVLRPGGEPGTHRFVARAPQTLAAPPPPVVDWATPVRGEPTAVAADGADVFSVALGEVRRIDRNTGANRWRADIAGVGRARPAVSSTRVAVTTGAEAVVLDRATGQRVSGFSVAGPSAPAIVPGPAGTSTVVAASESGMVVAADAETGTIRWVAEYSGSIPMAPLGEGGLVVVAWEDEATTTVRTFDAAAGALRWQYDVGARAGAPTVTAGLVLVAGGAGVHDASLRAIDLATGRERWSTPVPGFHEPLVRPVADGATRAYVLDGVGTVTAVDLGAGAVQWQQATGASVVDSSLVLTPGAVVFSSFADELVVLDRGTGAVRSAEVQRGVPIDLVAAGDRLVVALRLAAPSRIEARPAP